jgi:hypothetical protein
MLMLASCGSPPFSFKSAQIPETMLKEDAAYTERLLKSEADSPDANLKEFDDFCDRSVELRTERLIKIQASLSSEQQKYLTKAITEHFNAENSLVRAKRRFYDLYSELRRLRARHDEVTRKREESSKLSDKYTLTDEQVANSQDLDKSQQRLETALHFAEESRDYAAEAMSLSGEVNTAAAKTLDAVSTYSESLKRALATEKLLASDLQKLGFTLDTSIDAAAGEATTRSEDARKAVQSQIIQ